MQANALTDPESREASDEPLDSHTSSREETARNTAGSTVWQDPDEAVDEGEEAHDADADNISGEDESVYSSEEDYEDYEEDDDEDDSTKPLRWPIGSIFVQRCEQLLETYRGMKSSGQAEDKTAETTKPGESAEIAEIVGSADSAESAESGEIAKARASWSEWVNNTDFMQLVEQSMWNNRFKPLNEEHERLRSIQAYLASAEFQTAWDASEGSKDPERDIGEFRKRLDRCITDRRLSRLLTQRLSGPNPSEGSSSKRSHSARVSRQYVASQGSTTEREARLLWQSWEDATMLLRMREEAMWRQNFYATEDDLPSLETSSITLFRQSLEDWIDTARRQKDDLAETDVSESLPSAPRPPGQARPFRSPSSSIWPSIFLAEKDNKPFKGTRKRRDLQEARDNPKSNRSKSKLTKVRSVDDPSSGEAYAKLSGTLGR
ncbi:hypothetical protein EHS25_000559 [Saitozyma podzolica]|uniref:Uncharacterized protein n=1 Tax=Saitozyma podzolica TaxID=1890683 RepID=A0A427YWJ0_9TREE|nr:hypothetical protein EHS25_000559 [Saitozyma podzolica]